MTGGRTGDATTVRIRNADLRTAFERGALDAALVPEPWGSELIADGLAEMVLPADRVLGDGHYPTVVLVVRSAFAREHPETVRQLLRAHREAVARAAADPAAVADAFRALSSSAPPPAVLDEGVAANRVTTDIDREGTRKLLDAADRAGYLRHRVTLDQLLPRAPG
jgi:NitT/TauT family transport system substrate-binding protein